MGAPGPSAAKQGADAAGARRRPGTRAAPIVAFAVFAAATGTLSLLRYWTFHSRSLDMAYYVRLVWGLAHGYLDQPVVGASHALGLHLEPVLVPFALLARAGVPIAEMLLVAQALAAAAAIFPAAALARRRLAPVAGEAWAFAAALSIYLLPTVTRCVDYDFHPSTMAIWPLLGFVNAVDARRWRACAAWGAAALACREDVGLQLACVGLTLVAWPRGARATDRDDAAVAANARRRDRTAGAVIAVAGLGWFLVYALLVQPRWLADPTTGSFGAHFARFGGGAGGVGGVLGAALADPVGLLRYLVSGDRPLYLVLLLAQAALLPLAAPRWLAGAAPIVGINLLSDLANVRALQTHYVTAAAPFIAAAAIAGAARLAAWRPGVIAARAPAALLAAACLVAWAARGASPLAPEWRWGAYRTDDHARRARAVVAATPPGAAVAAPSPLAAHLAARPVIQILKRDRIPFPNSP